MLKRTLSVSFALVLFLPALLHADDVAKAQDKDLDGRWDSVAVVDNGEEVAEAFVTILVQNDKVTMTEGTRITIAVDGAKPRQVEDSSKVSGTIKVYPKTSAIDFIWEDGPAKGKTLRSIYNINNDVLVLCMSPLGKDRPTEFSTRKGSGCTVITLKRVKK